MKALFDFFLKRTDKENEIAYGKAKLLLILGFANLGLVSTLIVIYIFQGLYKNIITNLIVLVMYSILIILIQRGKNKCAGNFFAVIISIVVSLSAVLNFSDNVIFNYFINDYYLFLFAIVFSAMFATRIVFVGSFVLMLSSSIIAKLRKVIHNFNCFGLLLLQKKFLICSLEF